MAGLSAEEDNKMGVILPSSDFKKLTRKLKSVIEKEIDDEDLQSGIINKLGELNRRSILDRLLKYIEKYKVPVEKLWKTGTDVKSELRKIIKRRNLYIHQGLIEDIEQYYDDSLRLRTLVELWILRLLDCPEDSINQNAFLWLAR